MKWLVRFLLWGTPLTWAATTFYPQYLRFLSGIAIALFAMAGVEMRLATLEVLAPVDLALFAALALSSYDVRWPVRLVRLTFGVVMLFVLEIVVLMSGIVLFLMIGLTPGSPAARFFQNIESLIAWAAAPIVWITLFRPRLLSRTPARGESQSKGPLRAASAPRLARDRP